MLAIYLFPVVVAAWLIYQAYKQSKQPSIKYDFDQKKWVEYPPMPIYKLALFQLGVIALVVGEALVCIAQYYEK